MRSLFAALLLVTGCSTYFVPVNHGLSTHPDVPIGFAKLTLRDSSVVWLYEAHITADSVTAERTDVLNKRVAFAIPDVVAIEAGRANEGWNLFITSLVTGLMMAGLLIHAVGT